MPLGCYRDKLRDQSRISHADTTKSAANAVINDKINIFKNFCESF